jgi:dTDP-4-amino-4,6-dideoxygalactose transaminase
MDEIMSVAREYGLFVVEDCAQAFGSKWRTANGKLQSAGSIGDIGAFSFFPSKNLGGFGDAGVVTTSDAELAGYIRMLIKHGGREKYNADHVGYNARLDTLQAAILLAKLRYIDDFNARRLHIAQLYAEGLEGLDEIGLPLTLSPLPSAHSLSHVFHQFTIRVPSGKRAAMQTHLKENGVDSMIYYSVPLHRMEVFNMKCFLFGQLTETEDAARCVLSLPIEPLSTDQCIWHVIVSIIKALARPCQANGEEASLSDVQISRPSRRRRGERKHMPNNNC